MTEFSQYDLFVRAALSLALGLIVGLQREYAGSPTAGIRTFPLITLMGFIGSLLATKFTGVVIAAVFVGLALILATSHFLVNAANDKTRGLTTEVASLCMFLVGGYLAVAETIALPVVLTGVIALLLYFKASMHGLVEQLGDNDVRAIMRFVLIAIVVLPMLPDQAYDRFNVLNPHEIWYVVVLIAAISLASYALQRVIGQKAGAVLGGLLGGLISSTAATFTYASRSQSRGADRFLPLAIIIASTVAVVRVLFEIFVLAPRSVPQITPPLFAFLGLMLVLSIVSYFRSKEGSHEQLVSKDPAQLKAAVVFALLYAVVLYGVAWGKEHFGQEGLYAISLISGFIDVDAITISSTKLVQSGQLDSTTGWRLVLVANLSNLLFKSGVCFFMGRGLVRTHVPVTFLVGIGGGIAILLLWP